MFNDKKSLKFMVLLDLVLIVYTFIGAAAFIAWGLSGVFFVIICYSLAGWTFFYYKEKRKERYLQYGY